MERRPERRPTSVPPQVVCFTVFRVCELHKTLRFIGFFAHTERRHGEDGEMLKHYVFQGWCW